MTFYLKKKLFSENKRRKQIHSRSNHEINGTRQAFDLFNFRVGFYNNCKLNSSCKSKPKDKLGPFVMCI